MKIKPRIRRVNGIWHVSIAGDAVYFCTTLADAFVSAEHVWRFQ